MQANSTRIYEALKRNRLQQKAVALAIGVSPTAVHAWCHGRAEPSGANLIGLVEYLQQFEPGITARQLLPVAGVMPDPATPSPDSEKVA